MLEPIKALISKQETVELLSAIDPISLDISAVNWVDLNGLDTIYHKITELTVRDTVTSYNGLEKFLHLTRFTSETESKYTFPRMENLKHLHLAWHKSYLSSFNSSFDSLEKLFIRYFSEQDLKIVSNLKKLKSLDLVQGKLASVDYLSSCSHIESLSLSYITPLKHLNELSQCTNLKNIELQNLPKIEEINLSGCKQLEKLTLENLKTLSDIQITSLSNLKYLKVFNINSLTNIDFIYQNRQLESLFIGECKKITHLENITQFTELKDYYVYIPINNNDLMALLNNKKLETLGLDKKNAINDFKWLTKEHLLKRIFVYFTGDEIDWHSIFSLPNITFIHIECTKKLKLEKSYEDISIIASSYGKKIYQASNFNTRYPFYRLDISHIS